MTKDLLKDFLKERERGIEAQYFEKRDAELVAKIRERADLHELAAALAGKLSVDDPALLERIQHLGITRETGAAFLLLPLVQVAWADGDVSEREREVVLGLAAERGIVAATPPHEQLLAWLRVRPAADLFDAAIDVLRVGYSVLPAPERDDRIRALFDACDRVAEASGGLAKLLGLSRGVSGEEAALLEEFRRKLRTSGSST